jgi:hypothetical protein
MSAPYPKTETDPVAEGDIAAHNANVAAHGGRLTDKRIPVDGSVDLTQLASGLIIPASMLDTALATDTDVAAEATARSTAIAAEATARASADTTHAALSGRGGHVPSGGLPVGDLSFDPATQSELDAETTARTTAAATHAALSGKGGHVPTGGLPASDLSFDPATQTELDAEAAARAAADTTEATARAAADALKQDTVTAGGGLTKTGATLDVGEGQGIDVAADSIAVEWGTGTNQVRRGDDAAYTNARTPTGHHASHEPGGSDAFDLTLAHRSGTHAARLLLTGGSFPAAGVLFKETDTGLIYLSDGAAWQFWKADGAVRKTGDETVNNSTAFQADDHLLFPIEPNEVWFVEAFLLAQGTSVNADFKFGWTGPTGATASWNVVGVANTSNYNFSAVGSTTTPNGVLAIGGSSSVGASAAANPIVIAGWFFADASHSGNVNLRWAQNTLTAEDNKLLTGSFLRIRRLV